MSPNRPSHEKSPTADLAAWVERFRGRRVLVHADLVADELLVTQTSRVSREAPVLILEYRSHRIVPGGGANAAANIAALGGVPVVVGEVGDDDAGRALIAELRRLGAETDVVAVRADGATPRKTRVLAGDVNVALQQVVRIDSIRPFPRDERSRRAVAEIVARALPGVDGVLVSDYGLGFVDPETVGEWILRSPERPRLRIALDSRHRLFAYPGVDVAAPSEPEVEAALGRPLASDESILRAGTDARERLSARALVLTRGSLGLVLFEDGAQPLAVPAFGHGSVADVTGAGDTVVATLSLALAAGASHAVAARLANTAAGIVVTKMGTATVAPDELTEALERGG